MHRRRSLFRLHLREEEFESLQPGTASGAVNVPLATGEKVAAAVAPRQKPSAPTVIPAIAPVRLLPIDTPQREGLIPDIKLGTGVRLKPYGYFKTSVIHDSSSPPREMIFRYRCWPLTLGQTVRPSFT